jgi:hypothetical protein
MQGHGSRRTASTRENGNGNARTREQTYSFDKTSGERFTIRFAQPTKHELICHDTERPDVCREAVGAVLPRAHLWCHVLVCATVHAIRHMAVFPCNDHAFFVCVVINPDLRLNCKNNKTVKASTPRPFHAHTHAPTHARTSPPSHPATLTCPPTRPHANKKSMASCSTLAT